MEMRASPEKLPLQLVPLPQRERREKSAVNAKRMLAYISLFLLTSFLFLPSSHPITYFLQWLPEGEKDLLLYGLISFYHQLKNELLHQALPDVSVSLQLGETQEFLDAA